MFKKTNSDFDFLTHASKVFTIILQMFIMDFQKFIIRKCVLFVFNFCLSEPDVSKYFYNQ